MVQTTQSRMADHRTGRRGTDSAARGFLAETKMRAVLVMVGDVFGKEPLQVPLIESNDLVEQLTTTAPHPALGNTILPGTFERGPHGAYLQGSNRCRDLCPVFCIPVMDEKSGSRPKRKRLPQLLDDPTACRMLGDVEMQDTAAIMADDEEAVENTEADRGHGEEVHGRNRFPVIRKKHAPALGWLGVSRRPLHPAGDGSLGGSEAQHEQFTVNARRAPGRVLRHHPEDQLSHFHRQFLPTNRFSGLRDPTPIQSKPSAMPANDRLRVHEHERLLPGTPETTGEYPEDFVNRSHRGSGMLALQHRQLLPESEIFQEQASMRSKAAGEQAQP